MLRQQEFYADILKNSAKVHFHHRQKIPFLQWHNTAPSCRARRCKSESNKQYCLLQQIGINCQCCKSQSYTVSYSVGIVCPLVVHWETQKSVKLTSQIVLSWLQMELTLMMVAERPMPIAQLRDKFLERQSIVMRQLKRREHLLEPRLKPEHLLLLARIKREFTRASSCQPPSCKSPQNRGGMHRDCPTLKLLVQMHPNKAPIPLYCPDRTKMAAP